VSLAAFRAAFPVLGERTYLFSGAIAPLAIPVRAALERWLDDWERRPLRRYDAAVAELDALRAAFARLIGAHPDEVAILSSTSDGAAATARLLGGRLAAHTSAYPSTRYAWLASGGQIVPFDDFTAVPEAAAVGIAHVAPLTGRRLDLARCAEAAHAAGARLVVDAAQSLGVLEIDVERDGVDVLYGTAMKWLCGPPGIGFLYVRSAVLDGAGVADAGYLHAVVEGEDWPPATMPAWPAAARRVELGMPAVGLVAAARAGIELIESAGVPAIAGQIDALAEHVIAGLRERGIPVRTPDEHAGVVAAEIPAADRVAAVLAERAVDVGGYPWGLLRIDPHAFCREEDIERALAALDAVLV
jgi:selenocysteine lyase/cysteine desulfurase